jgi:hypothetical protein
MSLGHGASIVRSGLVLHLDAANIKSYPGSGTTWSDLSSGGNNGTLTNGPTYGSSNKGIITFDGTNDYATIPDVTGVTDFAITDNYTVDFSVYLNSTQNDTSNSDNDVIEKWSGGVGSIGYPYTFRYIRASNALQCNVYNATTVQTTSITISSNNWWHICGVFNWSSSLLTLYGNGGQIISSRALTLTGNITNTSALYLMRRGGVSSSNYATGSLSALKIYNRALTAAEVKQNFEATRGRYGI